MGQKVSNFGQLDRQMSLKFMYFHIRLIINNSLDHGTQLPYIKRAQKLGYDILVTNTNDNGRTIKNKLHPIKGLEDSFKHANYVFEHIIIPAKPESVAIVAHSFGAMVVRELVSEVWIRELSIIYKQRVSRIAGGEFYGFL